MGSSVKILFTCPACAFRAHIPDRLAGKRIRCPGCSQAVPVTGCEAAVRYVAPAIAAASCASSGEPTPRCARPIGPESRTVIEAPRRTFLFACPTCRFYAQVPMRAYGKNLRCPGCALSSMAGSPAAPEPMAVASTPAPVAAPTAGASDRIRALRASATPAAAAATVRIANTDPMRHATTRRIAAASPSAGTWSPTPAASPIHIEVGGVADVSDEVYAPTTDHDEPSASDGDEAEAQAEAQAEAEVDDGAQPHADAEPEAGTDGEAEADGDSAYDEPTSGDEAERAHAECRPTAR
ncbi:MAG: hypothetical protein H0X45_11075, partial [Planctomycetes bacterium]|nr:hypothetical protein [Planctomycetota bacterium]